MGGIEDKKCLPVIIKMEGEIEEKKISIKYSTGSGFKNVERGIYYTHIVHLY
jgi:hypothetical protein